MASPDVVIETAIHLASPPRAVWPLITDTDRTNRLLTRGTSTYRPIEEGAATAARFVVETRAAGFAMTYEEAPFEWTVNKAFSVSRRMRSGPLTSYTYAVRLEPTAAGGTKATVRLALRPRHWLLKPIVKLQGARFVKSVKQLAHEIDRHLRDGAPSPYDKPATPVDESRIAHGESELRKRDLTSESVRTIIELLRNAPDSDLVRLRPFEIAARSKLEPREMLRAFLHAVTVGLLELRWALVCPSCQTANEQVKSLAEIGPAGHCQLCDLGYGIDLDQAVEATFVPHPAVRVVQDQMFCIGGPWRTPHVVAQVNLDAQATRGLEVPSEPGRYRLFARGGAMASVEVTDDGRDASVILGADGFSDKHVVVGPGHVVEVKNATREALHVKVERLGFATLAATAHVLTTMSEFRRLFSRDLLKPGTPLKVASSAILFSDLTGSTALYTSAGDAAAFRLVDDHFDVLRKVIDAHEGTVVKTMGDAVMAAFVDPRSAIRCAAACLQAFEQFRGAQEHGAQTGLKLGVFSGPCYVITANDAVDYFGQTVNCAARVQHLAASGELVFEADALGRLSPTDREPLEVVEQFETIVKGVASPLRLVRTRITGARDVGVPLASELVRIGRERAAI